MPNEPDIPELLTLSPNSPAEPENLNHSPPVLTALGSALSHNISIERDLAVQVVGSDAGKARRMRPHGAMTRGSTGDELFAVQAVMRPFLVDEIRRVHEDRTHRPRVFRPRATPSQAAARRAFCQRFAACLELNLEKHPGDDNRHRSRQRLARARRVVARINAALGLSPDDGRTPDQCWRQATTQAEVFSPPSTPSRLGPEPVPTRSSPSVICRWPRSAS